MPHPTTLMPFHAPSSFFISHSPLFTDTTGDGCYFNFPVDVTHQTCLVARTWFFIYIFISHIIPYSPFHLFPFLSFNFSIFQRFSTVLRHPAFLRHFAFNEVYSPFPHSHASNALPSSPTTLSDNLSISQTMPNCTNTSKTASLFNLSSSPYHFQSSSAAYIHQTIQTIIRSHLTSMITVDTMPFHPNAHQRLQTTKSLCR